MSESGKSSRGGRSDEERFFSINENRRQPGRPFHVAENANSVDRRTARVIPVDFLRGELVAWQRHREAEKLFKHPQRHAGVAKNSEGLCSNKAQAKRQALVVEGAAKGGGLAERTERFNGLLSDVRSCAVANEGDSKSLRQTGQQQRTRLAVSADQIAKHGYRRL